MAHRHLAGIHSARDLDGAQCWAVVVGAKCEVSRRALHDELFDPVLALRNAGRLPKFDSAGSVAATVRSESDGWCGRRLSLGAARQVGAAGSHALGISR